MLLLFMEKIFNKNIETKIKFMITSEKERRKIRAGKDIVSEMLQLYLYFYFFNKKWYKINIKNE